MSPYASKAQSRFMHAKHPKVAKQWDQEMKKEHKSQKKLPQHVKRKK